VRLRTTWVEEDEAAAVRVRADRSTAPHGAESRPGGGGTAHARGITACTRSLMHSLALPLFVCSLLVLTVGLLLPHLLTSWNLDSTIAQQQQPQLISADAPPNSVPPPSSFSMSSSVSAAGYRLEVASSPDDLSSRLVAHLRTAAESAVGARGVFHVAVSGGSLPATLGKALLAASPRLDVSAWRWWFADERCVKLSDSESNYAAVEKAVFQPLGVKPENIHPIDESKIGNPKEVSWRGECV
jgi:hypothetical protein